MFTMKFLNDGVGDALQRCRTKVQKEKEVFTSRFCHYLEIKHFGVCDHVYWSTFANHLGEGSTCGSTWAEWKIIAKGAQLSAYGPWSELKL
jgi:hypothetical protein